MAEAGPAGASTSHSFYPNSKYVERKLAGEKIDEADLKALASAQAAAVKAGVMSPEIAKYFLANSLVEGRPGNYGITVGLEATGKANKYEKQAKLLGVEPSLAIEYTPKGKFGPTQEEIMGRWFYDQQGDSFGTSDPLHREHNAKLAALKLATLGGSPDQVYKKWNGAGPGADNHWKKVQETQAALDSLQQNKSVRDLYNQYLMASSESSPTTPASATPDVIQKAAAAIPSRPASIVQPSPVAQKPFLAMPQLAP